MKILEAQSAILTNFEVHQFLLEQKGLRQNEFKQYDKKADQIRKENERKQKAAEKSKDVTKKEFKPTTMIGPRITRRPRNLETIVRELLDYFNTAPSPLASKPYPYNEHTIKNLLIALRSWDFTKAEIIMIMNLRPIKPEILNTIVDSMEQRFPGDEQQAEICDAIRGALGAPNVEAEIEDMRNGAEEARKHQDEVQNQDVVMEDG